MKGSAARPWPCAPTPPRRCGRVLVALLLAMGVCLLACSQEPLPPKPLKLAKYLPFKFDLPVAMVPQPGSSKRWFVLGQMGGVWLVDRASGKWQRSLLLDISEKVTGPELYTELGLLGMALYPEWDEHPLVFLAYTVGDAENLELILSRFEFMRDSRGERINRRSEQELLRIPLEGLSHVGGTLQFGPDGYLYFGIGDGSNPATGQDRSQLRGSVIRIEVGPQFGPQFDPKLRYGIPPDNPPAEGEERPELFAWGLRNPWKFSFDRETKQMWVGDVGMVTHEEIDLVEMGGNYGWACYEGPDRIDRVATDLPSPIHFSAECERGTFQPPVSYYGHPEGCSVIGGYVYRGHKLPWLNGTFLFGDHCNGKVYGLRVPYEASFTPRDLPFIGRYFEDEEGKQGHEVLLETGRLISSFAEGHNGELYLIDRRGYIYALR